MTFGRSPAEFWNLHPEEFHWLVEAQLEQQKKATTQGGIAEEEALDMKDELLRMRAKRRRERQQRESA